MEKRRQSKDYTGGLSTASDTNGQGLIGFLFPRLLGIAGVGIAIILLISAVDFLQYGGEKEILINQIISLFTK